MLMHYMHLIVKNNSATCVCALKYPVELSTFLIYLCTAGYLKIAQVAINKTNKQKHIYVFVCLFVCLFYL